MASYADIEQLVLSGELFNGPSRSSSPRRSPSPDTSTWHDDLVNSDNSNDDPPSQQHQSIGMAPGRTGVKGVIRDREEARAINQSKQAREIEEVNSRFEGASLGGKTFLEEEKAKLLLAEREATLTRREKAAVDKTDMFGRPREGRFGHLREVGLESFLTAVENAGRGVWVVVHIFEPSLDRCYVLDSILTRLARSYPDTKFIHARASKLGFALKSSVTSPSPTSLHQSIIGCTDNAENEVDLDMLPTMLIYQDGELVHNWVRVDWEAGALSCEDLLKRHQIIALEDEEDPCWSDDDR